MSLWRLEWLRLMRTRRIWILVGVYVFFGVLGPVTIRYLPELLAAFGAEVPTALPPAVPAEGIRQFNGNAQQLGLLAVTIITAMALGIDAKRGIGIFFRTRSSIDRLVLPRAAVSWLAAAGAYTAGALVAAGAAEILLGSLPWGRFVLGVTLEWLYLAFVVAVVLLVSSFVRSTPATVGITIGVLIVLGIATLVRPLAEWLPSALPGALDDLLAGGGFTYARSIVVTVLLCGLAWPAATRRLRAREI